MSEISVTLPFSLIGEYSIDEFINKVKGFSGAQAEIDKEKARAESYKSTMLQWASHLQSILDQDVDDFQKRQNLRQFARDTQEFANQIERIHQ